MVSVYNGVDADTGFEMRFEVGDSSSRDDVPVSVLRDLVTFFDQTHKCRDSAFGKRRVQLLDGG